MHIRFQRLISFEQTICDYQILILGIVNGMDFGRFGFLYLKCFQILDDMVAIVILQHYQKGDFCAYFFQVLWECFVIVKFPIEPTHPLSHAE